MPETNKVNGAASYFRFIEKTYGESIEHWMDILEKLGPLNIWNSSTA